MVFWFLTVVLFCQQIIVIFIIAKKRKSNPFLLKMAIINNIRS